MVNSTSVTTDYDDECLRWDEKVTLGCNLSRESLTELNDPFSSLLFNCTS